MVFAMLPDYYSFILAMRSALLFIVFSGILLSCQKPSAVQYRGIDGLQPKAFDGKNLLMAANVKIYNPNKFEVKVWQVAANCKVNGQPAGTLSLDTLLRLPALTEISIPVEANIDTRPILSNGISLLFGNDIPYSIIGSAKAGKGSFKWTIPFTYDGSLTRKQLESLVF